MSTIYLRKLIAALVRENAQRDAVIDKLEETIGVLESRLNEVKKQHNTDVIV
jgi:phage shock protein A